MGSFSILSANQKYLIDNKNLLTKSQKYKLRASVKRTLQWYIFGALTVLIAVFYVLSVYHPECWSQSTSTRHQVQTLPHGQLTRYLLSSDDYPESAFTDDQLENGAWLLYFLGMLYTFVGIALVCDEFFVPAIELIVEHTHMSPDTAGATWMAAGGSAPELFTSLIGTLILESDVGFGTIVGSAVFNVLFVIGCCAIFTPGDLRLTWWPFARDSLYYTMCLIIVAIFFGVATRYEIYWYEALILLSLYFGYVTLMKKNKKLHHWFYRKFLKKDASKPRRNTLTYEPKSPPMAGAAADKSGRTDTKGPPAAASAGSAATEVTGGSAGSAANEGNGGKGAETQQKHEKHEKQSSLQDVDLGAKADPADSRDPADTAALTADKSNGSREDSDAAVPASSIVGAAVVSAGMSPVHEARDGDDSISISGSLTVYDQPRSGKPIEFHVSLFDFMTKDNNLTETAGVHMVARIRGEVKDTFNYIDANGDGNIDLTELKTVLHELGESIADQDARSVFDEIDEDNNGLISFHEFEKWYLQSAQVMRQDVRRLFKKFDVNDDNHMDAKELKDLLKVVNDNSEPSQEDLLAAMRELDKQKSGRFTEEQFVQWWEKSHYFDAKQEMRQRTLQMIEEDEDEGIDLSFPDSTRARILYCITAPIMFALYYSMPDVQKEEKKDRWPITFVMSILWLGGMTYVMVWFAVVVGASLGIPDEVMGLTFLAAGTSVPDLLTSVIVARHGEADMAVSSSIGSNIFDVLVGLPFPWLLYCIIFPARGGKVPVQARSLFGSLILLVIMLLCVLLIIKCNNWKMTHSLGYAMFMLYVVFVVQDLVRQAYGVEF